MVRRVIMTNPAFWGAAMERAITSATITMLTCVVGNIFGWLGLSWDRAWALTAGVFVISVFKSVAATAFTGQPSLNKSEVLAERKRRKEDTESTDTDVGTDVSGGATDFGDAASL